MRYLGVVAGDEAAEASVAGLEELTGLDAPLRLFAFEPEAPRAWLAFAAERAQDQEQALRSIVDTDRARRRPPVVVSGQPEPGLAQLFAAGGGHEIQPVSLREPKAERLEISASVRRPALLVVADAWSPGWLAEVNGSETEIHRVAGTFRGVVLPPGEHCVVLRYTPVGWTWGLRLGLLGLLGLLGGAVLSWRWRASLPAP